MPLPDGYVPEVIVVGSGASGGMAAYVLAKAGVRTLLLEAGRNYDPAETPMFDRSREAPLAGTGTDDKPFGYYDATVNGGWQVPGEPYTSAEGSHFRWWRARMLGGRTNHWGRHVPRFGPYDFKGRSRDGHGVDWPIGYEDVAPFYDRVEKLVGVCGSQIDLENHPASPPGVLHEAPKPRVPELLVEAACNALDIPCIPTRMAILTHDLPDEHSPRQACFNATDCTRGCSIGAAFQTTTSLLPMALATGNLRILTNAMAARVRTDTNGRATGVDYFEDGTPRFVAARVVVLGASACETARILLNSIGDHAPQGLANSSGQVGRNLTDTVGADVQATIPALFDRPRYNEDGIWMPHRYIPFWLYKEQAAGQLDFKRAYHIEFAGRFVDPVLALGGGGDGYGAPLKADIHRTFGARINFAVRGEMLANENSYCDLDPTVKDRFGLPVLRFHWKWGDEELRMVDHASHTIARIVERMGAKLDAPLPSPEQMISEGGSIIHELGTARMGSDPRTSVVNQYGQTWDVPNLFLVDGAVFASNPHKNATLTMMALAMRGMEHLVTQLRKGAL
ncbi:GMC family oxidoreductase [Caulobacter sp. FWC2]|nr:GMC family oxidoreductase [Caulobacter sp. FWC2]